MPSGRCHHRHLKVIPKILIALKYFVSCISCIPEIRVSTSSTFLFQVFVFYLHLIFYKTFSIAMISFEFGCGIEGCRIPFSFSFLSKSLKCPFSTFKWEAWASIFFHRILEMRCIKILLYEPRVVCSLRDEIWRRKKRLNALKFKERIKANLCI